MASFVSVLSNGFSASPSSIGRPDPDDHYCPYRVIYPIGDGVAANNFDLPFAEALVLIGKITRRVRIFSERANKVHNQAALVAARGDNFQQVEVKINPECGHLSGFFLIEFALKLIR
jgi:hypothetical protein